MTADQGFAVSMTATARTWGTTTQIPLSILTGELTDDISWSPRTQGSLTIAATPDVLALDPRRGVDVFLTYTVTPLDGDPAKSATWRLLMDKEATISGTGTVEVAVYSVDYLAHIAFDGMAFATTWITTDVLPLMFRQWLTGSTSTNPATSPVPMTLNLGTYAGRQLGVHNPPEADMDFPSLADVLNSSAEIHDFQWYADRAGIWQWERRRNTVPVDSHDIYLTTGQERSTVTRLESGSALGGDGYANHVALFYDKGDTLTNGLATQTTGPLAVGKAPRKTLVLKRRGGVPSATDRNAAAAAVLRRVVSYGDSEEVHAVPDPALKPDMVARIEPAGQPFRQRLVRSVSFRFPGPEMTVITRNPT